MHDRKHIYIDGSWVEPSTDATLDVINPANETVAGRIPMCTAADVDRAVEAAQAAFEGWAATPLETRIGLLKAIAGKMKERTEDLAAAITAEMGSPARFSGMVQVGMPTGVMGSYAKIAGSFVMEEEVGNSLVVKEPVGVCGFITPWNYPLHQVVGKVAPALAAGCTMVLKPSEVAPLSTFLLADILHEVGLPKGVFNLVSGDGPTVGEAIASHEDIDMVSFTGSTRAGVRVAELAAKTVKRVTQELGGKSANIILDDADLKSAVVAGVRDVMFNTGQTCSALTRMLVPKDKQDEAAEIAAQTAAKTVLGDPSDTGTHMGPVVSATQKSRVVNYIRKGLEEGASLVAGGPEDPEGMDKGYFVRPTIFKNVDPSMVIAQEEIFGPVLCIIPYEDEADAVAIANDSNYGLSGAVWSGDADRAKAVARKLRTGQVSINGGRWNHMAPFGGYKQSGNGRELGPHGLYEFLEVKSLQL